MSAQTEMNENDKNVQQWKIKKLIKGLEAARGYGLTEIRNNIIETVQA